MAVHWILSKVSNQRNLIPKMLLSYISIVHHKKITKTYHWSCRRVHGWDAVARLAWLARRRLRFQHGLHLAFTWAVRERVTLSRNGSWTWRISGLPLLMLPWISRRICCNTPRNVWLYRSRLCSSSSSTSNGVHPFLSNLCSLQISTNSKDEILGKI